MQRVESASHIESVHHVESLPRDSEEAPQIAGLAKQFFIAAQAPPPNMGSRKPAPSIGNNSAGNDFTGDVCAIGWDIYGLSLRQLREVKALGFDAVIMNCHWQEVQSAASIWNWSKFQRYAQNAHDAGLQLIFRGPLFCPLWMDESFAMLDSNGKASFHGLSGRIASFWNRDAQHRIDEFISRAWDALGLENFWALEASIGQGGECIYQSVRYNADGSYDDEIPLWCFDEWALQSFRLAMRARYGDDLNALNRAAGQKWKRWNEVLPARNVEAATYFGDTLAWYQGELLRHIDGMIHRLQPHHRVILSRAASLDFAPRFWGSGNVEFEPQIWELGAKWRRHMVEVLHFYYSLLTYLPSLHYYFSNAIAKGKPQRAFAGVEYSTGAKQNAPKIQRMGCAGMICGVNDHLYQFHGGAPTHLMDSNARELAQAIERFKEQTA